LIINVIRMITGDTTKHQCSSSKGEVWIRSFVQEISS
jgi:hypothetical protein